MGFGVPLILNRERNHFVRVAPHEWDAVRTELEASSEQTETDAERAAAIAGELREGAARSPAPSTATPSSTRT